MGTVNVLLVDDDTDYSVYTIDLINRDIAEITADPSSSVRVRHVTNQEDANLALAEAPPGGFQLVLLDLLYYKDRVEEAERRRRGSALQWEGDWTEFQGMLWLPELWRLQPNAAVVIMTSYALEGHLQHVVTAIRDFGVAEFIPKDAPWDEVKKRLADVWTKYCGNRMIAEAVRSARRLRPTVTIGQDADALLSQARTRFYQIADRVEAGDASEIASAPAKLRLEIDNLYRNVQNLFVLPGISSQASESCDVTALVRQQVALFRVQALRAGVAPEVSPGPIVVTTYTSELAGALQEIILNALDALELSPRPAQEKSLKIDVIREADCAKIVVTDNAGGLSQMALEKRFERGFTENRDDSHKGVGLYVARRMMHNIGGDIAVENWPSDDSPQGARAVLTVPDLG